MIKKLLYGFFLVLVLLAGLSYLYRSYLIDQFSELITKRVQDDFRSTLKEGASFDSEIDLSLFEHFPKVGFSFTDLLIRDAFGKKDTLLYAQQLSFLVGLTALFNEELEIEGIALQEARANLKVNADGKSNWDVWTDEQSSATYLTEKAQFENLRVNYQDLLYGYDMSLDLASAALSGKVQGDLYSGIFSGNGAIGRIRTDTSEYLANKLLSFDITMKGDLAQERYEVEKGKISLEGNELQIDGSLDFDADRSFCDLAFKGKALRLGRIIPLLPPELFAQLNGLQFFGQVELNSTVKGTWSDYHIPAVEAEIVFDHGSIEWPDQPRQINAIEGTLHIRKDQNTAFSFANYSIAKLRSKINGFEWEQSMTWNGGTELFNWSGKGMIDLPFFQDWLEKLDFEDLTGLLSSNGLEIAADLSKKEWTVNGPIELSGLEWKSDLFPDCSLALQGMFQGESFDIEKMTVASNSSMLSMRGRISELVPWMTFVSDGDSLKSSPEMYCDLQIESPEFELSDWMPNSEEEGLESSSAESNPFFASVNGELGLQIDQLNYGKTQLTNMVGELCWKQEEIVISDLLFHAFDGQAEIAGNIIRADNGNWQSKQLWRIADLDLSTCLANTDTDVAPESVQGKVIATAIWDMEWDNQWHILKPKLKMNCDFQLLDFELIAFEPLMEMVDFDKKERYELVQFETIQNQLLIEDWQFRIPRTTVASNRLNFDISVNHSLENKMSYHVKVDLLDYLAKRFFRKNQDNRSVEKNSRGGMNYYFSIYGNPSDPTIRKSSKKKVEQRFFKDERIKGVDLNKIIRSDFRFSCMESTSSSE